MSFLLDANVLSELRKGSRCNPSVAGWFSRVAPEDVFLSVVTVGELHKGVELIRRRDPRSAEVLSAWIQSVVTSHEDRILAIDLPVAETWGRLNSPNPLPVIDSLLGATALVHGLVVATRNVEDIARTGAPWVNPFTGEEGAGR